MRNQLLIAVLLGLVSAVVFASATTGPMLMRYVLFLLTSLPIFLAGLGWGWRFAGVAGQRVSASSRRSPDCRLPVSMA